VKVKNLQRGTANAGQRGRRQVRQLIIDMGNAGAIGKGLDEILNGSLTFLQLQASDGSAQKQTAKKEGHRISPGPF
jgi:hypothetical protein